jgi:hypothetical protein
MAIDAADENRDAALTISEMVIGRITCANIFARGLFHQHDFRVTTPAQ